MKLSNVQMEMANVCWHLVSVERYSNFVATENFVYFSSNITILSLLLHPTVIIIIANRKLCYCLWLFVQYIFIGIWSACSSVVGAVGVAVECYCSYPFNFRKKPPKYERPRPRSSTKFHRNRQYDNYIVIVMHRVKHIRKLNALC